MKIDEKEVAHVAHLARLRLTEGELSRYAQQLGRVLEHMEELRRINTDGVPPAAHSSALTNVLREDVPRPFAGSKELLAAAPQSDGDYFTVPKVIE
ncbi:MAG: Asp-tRNA(Asn)/Glu-tRNA(Gln) amidotransferase subunit GatC [Elusimicrobiota bacterium]